MLTLVPGVSGGSETYARGLTAALATLVSDQRDDLDVRAFVPALAPDAGDGLPTEVVDEYRSGAGAARRVLSLATGKRLPGPRCGAATRGSTSSTTR